jgi:threonine synthase
MRYVSHLACTICGTKFSAETPMNRCPHDGRPIQVMMDLDRREAECGCDGWWNPARRDLWRFGGLLPLDINDAADSRSIVTLGEGCTPSLAYAHPLSDPIGFRLEVKDEGRHHRGFGANPTRSSKDRRMWLIQRIALQGAKSRSLPPGHSPSAGGGVE